jgi:acetyl-CoA carboxylase biotin carboxyl carrier protein
VELAELEKIMATFDQSSMRELRINDGDFHLYLSKNQAGTGEAQPMPTQAVEEPSPEANAAQGDAQIKAPLVGTVYLQAKPQQPPYVHVGSQVKEGDVVCVIEAMKMMTEIRAKVSGTVKAVNVENGELVEVDQPLFTLTKEQQ